MKKLVFTALAIAVAAVTLSAKPKKMEVVVDFSNGNPLVAVPGESPEKPSFKNPRKGIEFPVKDFKNDLEAATAAGYVECNKDVDGKVMSGYHFPVTAFTFQSNGKTYPLNFTTNPTPGRAAFCYYYAKGGYAKMYKPHMSVPSIDGYVLTGFKVNIVPPKKGSDDFTFRFYKNGNRKQLIGKTNGDDGTVDVLETDVEGVVPGDVVNVYSYNIHMVKQFVFIYSPVAKSKKK